MKKSLPVLPRCRDFAFDGGLLKQLREPGFYFAALTM
jgi:hypothetical protein